MKLRYFDSSFSIINIVDATFFIMGITSRKVYKLIQIMGNILHLYRFAFLIMFLSIYLLTHTCNIHTRYCFLLHYHPYFSLYFLFYLVLYSFSSLLFFSLLCSFLPLFYFHYFRYPLFCIHIFWLIF